MKSVSPSDLFAVGDAFSELPMYSFSKHWPIPIPFYIISGLLSVIAKKIVLESIMIV